MDKDITLVNVVYRRSTRKKKCVSGTDGASGTRSGDAMQIVMTHSLPAQPFLERPLGGVVRLRLVVFAKGPLNPEIPM